MKKNSSLTMKEYAVAMFISTKNNEQVYFQDLKMFFSDSEASIRNTLKSLLGKNIIQAKNVGKNTYVYKLLYNTPTVSNNDMKTILSNTSRILKILEVFIEEEEPVNEDKQGINHSDKIYDGTIKLLHDEIPSLNIDTVIEEEEEEIRENEDVLPNHNNLDLLNNDVLTVATELIKYYAKITDKTIESARSPEFVLPYLYEGVTKKDIKDKINIYVSNENEYLSPELFFQKKLIEML